MRIQTFAAATALAMSLAGCGRDDTAGNLSTDVNLDVNQSDPTLGNAADLALPTDAAGFAKAVAASDLYEIESARIAATKGSAAIKTFAKMLEADHTKSTADLKAAAGPANITVVPELDAEKQGLIDALKAAPEAGFDRLFVEQQTTAHQKALALLEGYASSGDNGALKEFAGKARTVVQGHLDQLKAMPK